MAENQNLFYALTNERRQPYSEAEWHTVRSQITHLYRDKNRTLKQVREIMLRYYQFDAR
jgi:hypothetical protein